MPNAIHRFFDPAYYLGGGAFPGVIGGITYDRINVVSGGVGGAGSAQADAAKVGGVNPGTYWVSFGEDATSLNTNRGFRALSENSDTFDDILHQDTVLPKLLPLVLGAPANTFTLPLDTYLGPTALALTAANLETLITITDTSGDEIMDVATGLKVRLISIAGFPNSPAPPFLPAPAVATLSANLSPGSYLIHIGLRTNLATASQDYYGFRFGEDHRVPALIQNLFRVLRAPAAIGEIWNTTPFTSTIYDLTLSGLNERYNRAAVHDTTIPSGSGLPTPIDALIIGRPGAGSWYKRTGHAMSAWSQRSLAGFGAITLYQDPLDALWTAHIEDLALGIASGFRGGASGMVTYGSSRTSIAGALPSDAGYQPGLAKFLGVSNRTREFSTGEAGLLSKLSQDSTITFQNIGGPSVEVDLAAGDYFWRVVGPDQISGVVVGFTMLEIEHDDPLFPGDVRRRTYIIRRLDSAFSTKCTVIRIDGGNPTVTNGQTGILRRVLSTEFFVGDGIDEYRQALGLTNGFLPQGFNFAQLPPITTTFGMGTNPAPAKFFASEGLGATNALVWGGFRNLVTGVAGDAAYIQRGILKSDGGIQGDGSLLMLLNGTFGGAVVAQLNITSSSGNIQTLTNDVISARDVISGRNILAFGGVGPSGFVAGRGISQGIHTVVTGNFFTAPSLDPAIQGFTTFIQTTNVVSAFFAAIYVNVPIGTVVDTDLWLTLWRSNPATAIVSWIPFMYSDGGFTPIPTYIDPSDLILPPLFGLNGSVSVFHGRQMGNAVYWKVHGHYAVP